MNFNSFILVVAIIIALMFVTLTLLQTGDRPLRRYLSRKVPKSFSYLCKNTKIDGLRLTFLDCQLHVITFGQPQKLAWRSKYPQAYSRSDEPAIYEILVALKTYE